MRFTAEITFAARSDIDALRGNAIATLARRAEQGGFDAIALNEHPVPSPKWLDAGGHDAFDPITGLGFCAAVTERARLMPYALILPYHNPFLTAKSIATLDVLSGGRVVVAAGAGYLRSEFAALGVEFSDRNAIFDEALEAMLAIWTREPVSIESPRFRALAQTATPRPVQQPHPAIWIAGNGPRARDRVARYGTGWAPLMVGDVGAATARTTPIPTIADLTNGIDDLRRRLERAGRDPHAIEIQVQGPASNEVMNPGLHVASHIEHLQQLASVGVTQFIVHLVAGDGRRVDDALDRYGSEVVAALD